MKNNIGEEYLTNEGYVVEIVDYTNNINCTIKFNDVRSTTLKNVRKCNLKSGSVSNPYHPSVFGIGYLGEGVYRSKINNMQTKVYITWVSMLQRCYSEKSLIKHPTYKGCSVSEEWYDFQVFGDWFEENYKEGFELDKDILVKGNKIYSPETCRFIPKEINLSIGTKSNKNSILPVGVHLHVKTNKYKAQIYKNNKVYHIGLFNTPEEAFEAYKETKEAYIKELAEKWKPYITHEIYQALINWEIEIVD